VTRIIAGLAGGHTLKVPAAGTRPTSDRVREAIFSRLDALTDVAGARVLDLYAGSGALGIEAASRGAVRVDLVDNSERAVNVMRANIASVAKALPTSDIRAHRASVNSFLDSTRETWDIVLLDPPYDVTNANLESALAALVPRLSADAIVAVERSGREPVPTWPAGYAELAPKDYGETRVYWLEPAE
jgi:16S rRNA (guanine966-N2)-methyltransferase